MFLDEKEVPKVKILPEGVGTEKSFQTDRSPVPVASLM